MFKKIVIFEILWWICIGLVTSFVVSHYETQKKTVIVVPGESIGKVKLGMSKEQVISVLGKPIYYFPPEVVGIASYEIGRESQYKKAPPEECERYEIFVYLEPPLKIIINKDNKVERIDLDICKNVSVKGYPFLEFKYLTLQEIQKLGKPSSIVRMELEEKIMMSKAPPGTILEFYYYFYNDIGLGIGIVFDRNKEKVDKHFIAVNGIDICAPIK